MKAIRNFVVGFILDALVVDSSIKKEKETLFALKEGVFVFYSEKQRLVT